MKLTSSQIVLYLIFIICILLISYYYTSTNTNTNTNTINNPNTNTTYKLNNINIPNPNPNLITPSQKKQYYTKESFSDDATGANDALKTEITTELNKLNITDVITQNKIFNYITSLSTLLNKYNYVDAPITINNNGSLCDPWGSYSNGTYAASLNTCINIPGQNNRTCLSKNSLVSCSKYYDDGEIENLNNINVNDLVNDSKYNIYLGINDINANVNKANVDMTNVLTDYISKRNLENQQLFFIKYNQYNLEDKKKIIDKTNKEFEKTENDVNINKIQFQQTVEQNKNNDAKKDTYYNYTFYLIILIIIVGVLNFMFSNLE